jgi:methyltransferase (TIGR00027 family)
MRANRSSRTAEYVAAMRGLGTLLPPEAQLIDDPWGARWTGSEGLRKIAARAPQLSEWLSRPAWKELLYMQVRTHALDEAVRRFARAGGRQLVLFGAGLDARALRLRELGLKVFEVDHPATHGRKREVIGEASTLVAWDFEKDPLRELPDRLAREGYVRDAIGCVLWEGVTMYLSAEAIEDSVAMLRELLAPGSTLALTYFGRERLDRPSVRTRLVQRFVARQGEPWTFGWKPSELAAWMQERGFALESDDDSSDLAHEYLPADFAKRVKIEHRRIAIARKNPPPAPPCKQGGEISGDT